MSHRHEIMLTLSLYGPIGRRLPIGHSINLNYHQKYHGSKETTIATQWIRKNNFYNGMDIRPVLVMCIHILGSQS